MAGFATLQEVKERLRIDHSDDDNSSLEGLIDAATGAVIGYLKSAADPYLNEDGTVNESVDVPAVVKTATIMLVGYFYLHPDQDPEGGFGDAALPKPVRAVLHHLRDPALA